MFSNFFQRKYLKLYEKRLLDGLSNHYNAAKGLDIMLIGTNYDVFAADMYTTDLHMNTKRNSTGMPTKCQHEMTGTNF